MRLRLTVACIAPCCCVAAPAAAQAKTTITISGSTSVAPLAAKLGQGLCEDAQAGKSASRSCRAAPTSASPTSRAAASRSATPRATRSRATRAASSFNRIARDGVCIVTNPSNPIANIVAGESRRSSPAGSATGAASRAPSAPARSTSSSAPPASGTQDAFQNIFMGSDLQRLRRAPARRPPTASSSSRSSPNPNAIGYVSLRFTGGRAHASPTRASPAPCATPSRASTAASRNFYMVTRGTPTGAAKAWIKWIRKSKTAQQDHRHRLGAAQVAEPARAIAVAGRPCAGACASRGRTSAPSACSARWPCAVLVLIAGMIVFVFVEGVAVVLAQRARLVRRPAATSTSSSATSSTRPPNPTRLRLHAARLAAALRRRPDHRPARC